MKANPALETTHGGKPHFPVLDGLRGVAAICVVIFHFLEMVIWPYDNLWIGHGFLAVDFFFCLSGFVLGYAYDDRLARIGFGRFFRARLIRLQPLVVLGSMLGLIAFYVNPFGIARGNSPGRMALIFVASLLMIPWGAMASRAFNLFSLNAPAWSLFWEYIASVVYGLVLYRIPRWLLVVLTIAAAALLCWTGHHSENLFGGWSGPSFWDGGARVAFSFLAGLLVYRMRWRLRSPLGFLSLSLLLFLSFVMPYKTGAWGREAAVIIIYFPLLVALGTGATISPRMERVCRFSGDLSYPLYMTHYSVIWIWASFAKQQKLTAHGLALWVPIGAAVMVAFATLVMIVYDQPVRVWLQSKWK